MSSNANVLAICALAAGSLVLAATAQELTVPPVTNQTQSLNSETLVAGTFLNDHGTVRDQTVASVKRAHPAAPGGLTVSASSRAVVTLRWVDEASNELGYHIERCLGVDCKVYEQVGTTAAHVIMYFDTRVKRDTVYSYRVRAVGAVANSPYSNGATLQSLQ
jgi:hypothetical protein